MDYYKIQEYKRKKFNKSQTARTLGMNRETVLVYWDMSPEDYAARVEAAKTREKKADPHKEFVLECLLNYPDMSAAQLYDWIKERTCLETLDFQERCFRDYVKSIREAYDIKKPETSRQYEAREELPAGKQAQVDMGEISLQTINGRHKKIYCFGMVMTHSRHKFILWQEKPFTTDTFVQAHIKAFRFFGGRPQEMVYDQDKILAVSENGGDIIYTEGFQSYVNEVKFDIFLCHGADPESKGLIENVIKYAKHGFAKHRIFKDIDRFNEECIAWLKRTGNKKKHGTTQKIPAEVFSLEKEYLIPVSEYSFTVAVNNSIDYQVRKDNIVLYKGNRYRVPKGTYRAGKRVFMVVHNDVISITDTLTGEIYASHPLCHDKGKLIGQKREERDKSKSLQEQEKTVLGLFQNDDLVTPFLEHIRHEKPRYYRDQLGLIRKLFEEWSTELLIHGLRYCTEKELYSAGDLKSSILYLNQIKAEPKKRETMSALPSKYRGNTPEVRDLSIYEHAMKRGVANG